MRILLALPLLLSMSCIKKTQTSTEEIRLIERDTDILDEEDLEELPEN